MSRFNLILWSVALLVCGLIAAASLVIKKQPNAKELIDKLVPYQGWIGLVVCVLGLWSVIVWLSWISMIRSAPMHYLLYLVIALVETALGFLLGYGLINKYVLSKNPAAAEKAALMQAKLLRLQEPLGLAGIALGLIGLIMAIVA